MSNLTSSLTVKLIDDVSKPAKTVAQALAKAEQEAKAVAKAMAGTNMPDRFQSQLARFKLSAKDLDVVSKAWSHYATSAKLAANAADWTKTDISGIRRWGSETMRTLREVETAQNKFTRSSKAARESVDHEHGAGRGALAAIAGGFAAHSVAHFGRESLDTYREFDNQRRFGRAVMGISDEDQQPLINQAIKLGGTSKYNDIAVLEAQRELAARGLKKDQILGMIPAAANLGQALDLNLGESIQLMDGAIFAFKKRIGTTAEATASANQTADAQVKAAKISGMTPEDIKAAYKYGAPGAHLSGVSEQTLLAFAAVAKKSNFEGNEAGTAFRALIAAGQSPTHGAREALLANGLDFSKYQSKVTNIPIDGFARNVAASYGVKLNAHAMAALGHVFSDPKLLNDPALFTPAVMKTLAGALKGKDAKSLKSIAGMANRFRNSAGGGNDLNGFIRDLLVALPGNLKLANALFGPKQGSRIAATLGDPEVFKALKEALDNHADGYAKNVSDQRMAGFDGAVSRFEGAVKNLESALPRAFDNDGKGGALTSIADKMGAFVQALAEAPPSLQRLGATAAVASAAFAGFKGAEALLGGFGLKGSAAALTEAAHLLMRSAGEKALPGLPGSEPEKAGSKGFLHKAGKVLAGAAVIGTAIETTQALIEGAHDLGLTPTKYDPNRPIFHSLPPPSTRRPLASPTASFGDLTGAKTALDALNTTVTPTIELSGSKKTIAELTQIANLLRTITGLAGGAQSAVRGINVPSLGATQRGNFSFGGVKGE